VNRYCGGRVPAGGPGPLAAGLRRLPAEVDAALAAFNFRTAAGAVMEAVDAANRLVNERTPWELARAGRSTELGAVLAALVYACRRIAEEIAPFVPALRLASCTSWETEASRSVRRRRSSLGLAPHTAGSFNALNRLEARRLCRAATSP